MKNLEITPKDIKENKDFAAMGYVWVFSLIILLARRESPFIQLHARQGLVLFLISLILWPLEITRYLEFVVLALALVGFIQAAMGNEYRIPLIADIAEGKFGINELKKYWHHIKHTAIRFYKPEHVTPSLRNNLDKQHNDLMGQQQILKSEERFMEIEEKKLSTLMHKVEDEETKIDKLEDEIHNEFRHLKNQVHDLQDKVDDVLSQ